MNNKIGFLRENFRLFHLIDKRNLEFNLHYHNFNKIIIFISGNVTYHIEGKSYILKPWDILLINKGDVHKPIIDFSSTYERIILWIDTNFIEKHIYDNCNLNTCFELSKEKKFSLVRLNEDLKTNLISIISNLEKATKDNHFGNTILSNSLFFQLLVYINRIYIENKYLTEENSYKYDSTIEEIINYINKNLSKDLSIDTLSSKYFISKYYLMRKFKNQIGSSIHNYVVQKRLILARSLISDGLSMSSVCSRCGFNDYSSFVRAFKKVYGVSPSNYNPTIHNFENPISDT